MTKAGERLIEAAKEAVAVARGEKMPGRVYSGWASWGTSGLHACNCIGPQPGEKLCPCMLRGENERKRRMLHEGIVIDGQPYRLVPAKPEPTP